MVAARVGGLVPLAPRRRERDQEAVVGDQRLHAHVQVGRGRRDQWPVVAAQDGDSGTREVEAAVGAHLRGVQVERIGPSRAHRVLAHDVPDAGAQHDCERQRVAEGPYRIEVAAGRGVLARDQDGGAGGRARRVAEGA